MYLIMKKKIPRNAPWGELPGSDLGEDDAPLYVRIIDLPVRYEERMRRSHAGTCIYKRSSITI